MAKKPKPLTEEERAARDARMEELQKEMVHRMGTELHTATIKPHELYGDPVYDLAVRISPSSSWSMTLNKRSLLALRDTIDEYFKDDDMVSIRVPRAAVQKFEEVADEFSRVSDAFYGDGANLSDYESADEDFKDAQFEFMETVIAALPKK